MRISNRYAIPDWRSFGARALRAPCFRILHSRVGPELRAGSVLAHSSINFTGGLEMRHHLRPFSPLLFVVPVATALVACGPASAPSARPGARATGPLVTSSPDVLTPVPVPTPAVSYTHLRAHETPEHLVCRLLLEKKKT